MAERTIERMGSIELEEFGLEVEREHHSLIHDSSSFRPALCIDGGDGSSSSASSSRRIGALLPSREQISILVRNANTKPSPLVRLGLTYRSGGMVRLSLVLVLLALAVLLSLRQESDETAILEARLSNVEILDVANNKYIIGDAGRIMPFAKCTTSSQCEIKLRIHAPPGDTSNYNNNNDKIGINVCECYATSTVQYFDECEGTSTRDDCHLYTCNSKTTCDALNVQCVLYKTENGNDETVGECKLSNDENNMDTSSENEDVDGNEMESSKNKDEDDINESTTEENVAEAEVKTVKDDGIEVEQTEETDKEAELIKEEEDDEQQIIDNNEGLEGAEIESKEPNKVESLVTEKDEHDEVEVKGGKVTKKSTPDEAHQGSEHVSEGKVAASPDVPITPPRREDDPTPAEMEEEVEDKNSDVSTEGGESHQRIDDDNDDDDDGGKEEDDSSMIRRNYRL